MGTVIDTDPQQRLYSPEQAARVLGVSRSKAWELVRDGQLRSTKVGKRRLVFADSIDSFVEQLDQGA